MNSEQRMPFGKYRGRQVREIPTDYLRWLSSIELRPPLREAVTAALKGKAAPGPSGVPGSTPGAGPLNVGAAAASPARSEVFQGSSPRREGAKPKRQWIPRPEQEDLSAYYSNGADDGIPY